MKDIEEKWKDILQSWIRRTNIYTTQGNLYHECNLHQNTTRVFHRARTNNPQICVDHPPTYTNPIQIAKAILKKKNKPGLHNSEFQVILQNRSDWNSMVLAQKYSYRWMEQNRKPRSWPTTIWSTNLQQIRYEYPMEKRQSLPQMVLGKL